MTVSIANGRILVTSGNGEVKLDSNERPFIITDYLSGFVLMPERRPADGHIDTTTTRVLGTCTAGSNWIMGACQFKFRDGWSYGSEYMSRFQNKWFNCSGTIVSNLGYNNYVSHSIVIDGARVLYKERMIIARTGPTQAPFEAYRYFYRLNIGRFHG